VLQRGAARTPSDPSAAQPPDLSTAARAARRHARAGHAVGRLVAQDAGVDTVVAEGTAPSDLRKGPGHYSDTALPGAGGTVAIAGHRTTYGAPFRHVDRLRRGDRIIMTMPYGRFVYAVERTRIVPPTATWVTRRVTYDRLVLTACHPLYSAAQRIVVFARLVRTQTL
jgi:sortase A